MHARLTSLRYDVAREREMLQIARELLLPLLRQLPGFQGIVVATDRRQPGCGLVLTRWSSAAQAEGLRDALGFLTGALQECAIELGTARGYEVILRE